MLTNKELSNVSGGVFKVAAKWIAIGGLLTFAIGTLNGILRPLGCSVK